MYIEEDIENLKKLNNLFKFFKTHGWIPNLSREINTSGIIEAIEHILAEREEDKKRIEELEVLEDDLKYVSVSLGNNSLTVLYIK